MLPEVHQILAKDRDPKIGAHTLDLCEVSNVSSYNLSDIIHSFDVQVMEGSDFRNLILYYHEKRTLCGKFTSASNFCLIFGNSQMVEL